MARFFVVVVTITLLFFGSMFIIFYTSISLFVVPLFWLLVIIPAQYFYRRFGQEEIISASRVDGTVFERKPEETEEVEEVPQEINPVLFSAKTLWPFDPVPDNLVIQEKSITFVRKGIFSLAITQTIPINYLAGTVIYSNPFFAVLQINIKGESRGDRKKEEGAKKEDEKPCPDESYNFPLTKDEALEAQEILNGLMLKQQGAIKIPPEPSVKAEKETLEKATKNKEIEDAVKKR